MTTLRMIPHPEGRHSFRFDGPDMCIPKMGDVMVECEVFDAPLYQRFRLIDGEIITPEMSFIETGSFNYMGDTLVTIANIPLPLSGVMLATALAALIIRRRT